jgi:hypothetical protein
MNDIKQISSLAYLAHFATCSGDANCNVCVRFEVFTAVTVNNGVFWDVALCDSCKNRRFGGT